MGRMGAGGRAGRQRAMFLGKTKRWAIIGAGAPAREQGARFFYCRQKHWCTIGRTHSAMNYRERERALGPGAPAAAPSISHGRQRSIPSSSCLRE